MFLTQIKNYSNTQFWRYLVGSAIVIAFSFLGQIPLFLGWIAKLGVEGMQNTLQTELMQILDSNTTLLLVMLSFVFALFGLVVVLKKIHHQAFKTIVTARSKVDWKRAFFSFTLFGAFVAISTYLDYQSNPEHYEWNFKLLPFIGLVIIAIVLIPIQTSVEEFVFRGYLMQGFKSASNERPFLIGFIVSITVLILILVLNYLYSISIWLNLIIVVFSILLGVIVHENLEKKDFYNSYKGLKYLEFSKNNFFPLFITSVIFGGMHLANPEVQELGYITMVYYISTGFFLGILTLMDDGMELALGFHAANNLFTALLVTADWTALQTNSILKDISEPTVGYEILMPVVVVYPILVFIFSKRYKWTNWKQRLLGSL